MKTDHFVPMDNAQRLRWLFRLGPFRLASYMEEAQRREKKKKLQEIVDTVFCN